MTGSVQKGLAIRTIYDLILAGDTRVSLFALAPVIAARSMVGADLAEPCFAVCWIAVAVLEERLVGAAAPCSWKGRVLLATAELIAHQKVSVVVITSADAGEAETSPDGNGVLRACLAVCSCVAVQTETSIGASFRLECAESVGAANVSRLRVNTRRRRTRVGSAHITGLALTDPLADIVLEVALSMPIADKHLIHSIYHTETAGWITARLDIVEAIVTRTRYSVPGVIEAVAMASTHQAIVAPASLYHTITFCHRHVTRTQLVDVLLTVIATMPNNADAFFSNADTIAGAFHICAWFNACCWNAAVSTRNRVVFANTAPRVDWLLGAVP